jgi:hypothetical protein
MFVIGGCNDILDGRDDSKDEYTVRTDATDLKEKEYYWSGGEKIWLETDSTHLIIGFINKEDSKVFSSIVPGTTQFAGQAMLLVDARNDVVMQKISIERSIKNKVFARKITITNKPFYLTGEIVLQLKEGVTPQEILSKFQISGKVVDEISAGVIVIQLDNWGETIQLANSIYESELVEWCHPNFITAIERTTSDPLYAQQYYLKNTGQNGGTAGIDIGIEEAWAITRGSSDIRVAVIDDGVEEHEDLAGRVLQGYTPLDPTGYGRPSTNTVGHGQACAGIIAASHNTLGIAGIAPNVQIIPVNIFYGGGSATEAAKGLEYAWNPSKGNADVISNSWGGATADCITKEINNAVNSGRLRNGIKRGCVVVFASGNARPPLSVLPPANHPKVIAVGAIKRNGTIWDYSCRGTGLDVVAPSGEVNLQGDVTTTDRMGSYGYESVNYTQRFGGTSAACPQVAGIAALILSECPNLSWSAIQQLIRSTCTKLPGYTYSSGWNNDVGYGLVNAYAALSKRNLKYTHLERFTPATITWEGVQDGGDYDLDFRITDPEQTFFLLTDQQAGSSFTFVPPISGYYTVSARLTTPTGVVYRAEQDLYVAPNSAWIDGPSSLGPGETGVYNFRTYSNNPVDPRITGDIPIVCEWEYGTGVEKISSTPTSITLRSTRTINDCDNQNVTVKLNIMGYSPSVRAQIDEPFDYSKAITLTVPNVSTVKIKYVGLLTSDTPMIYLFSATPATGTFVWEYAYVYNGLPQNWQLTSMSINDIGIVELPKNHDKVMIRVKRTSPCGTSYDYYSL